MNDMAPTLSLCMILRDEAANLPRSLAPIVRCFDEVVVVDTGSRDETPELAVTLGARVTRMKWPHDFAAARNRSIREARGDWIMWLDGDNQIKPEDVDLLRRDLDNDCRSVLWCTEVVVPQGDRLIQKRVFPRRPEVFFSGRVHEQLIHPSDYRSVLTGVEILHWGYEDFGEARKKGLRNLRLLQEMVEEHPEDFYLCYQMGQTLLNLRRFEPALFWLERAVANREGPVTNPGLHQHAHLLKCQVLERLGRHDEAEQVLLTLLRIAPEYGPGYLSLGRIQYSRKNFERVVELLLIFFDLGVGDFIAGLSPERMKFMAAMMLGRSLEQLGRLEHAVEAFNKAAATNPDNPEPLLAMAGVAMRDGRAGEARARLTRCLEMFPGNRRAVGMLKVLDDA